MGTANNDQELESASVILVDGLHFAGDICGVRIDLDAEESGGGVGAGPQPHRLLLLAMAGCTAIDILAILTKQSRYYLASNRSCYVCWPTCARSSGSRCLTLNSLAIVTGE